MDFWLLVTVPGVGIVAFLVVGRLILRRFDRKGDDD